MEILNIVEGTVNLARKKFGIADSETEMMAVLRERACREWCTENNGTTFLTPENKCSQCGCDMEKKWRAVDAACPFKLW
jgi:uncharacterized protein (DUF983 family)